MSHLFYVLGSSSGLPSADKATSGYLLKNNDSLTLIDCGGGVTQSFLKRGFNPLNVDRICISHTHSDHVCELSLFLQLIYLHKRKRPLDLFLPEKNGVEVLKDIMRIDKEMLVILITGYGTVETAVTAMKEGAYDFINKPLDAEKVELIIKKALKTITLKKELSSLHKREVAEFNENFIVDENSIRNQILQNMKNAAITDVPILISGESGTGKEILAKAVYFYSKRFSKPFVSINCSAIPTEILESELFGYEGGSFTGASAKGKPGIFEIADGGTIFFDEIGELDLKAQTKLLRFLQEKEIQKVGSTKVKKVDVRVIAATNKDLKYEVGQKTFREDLFYRLNVFNVVVPPLKERREAIVPLASYFV
ncbi:MAG: sigma 54-interacting transcriptional regulator [Spirochaetales bacterium]|nr:sigma 54-interacting transcriptional regulator [Spirochaetales bacterium]